MRARGFTLIELCCVTGIISILAATAAHQYSYYVYRAQAAEALAQVETLAHLEQVRILEAGAPIACRPAPATLPRVNQPVPFPDDACWRDLGFRVVGRVRFQYETRVSGKRDFSVFARGDLDGDGVLSEYSIASDTLEVTRSNPE